MYMSEKRLKRVQNTFQNDAREQCSINELNLWEDRLDLILKAFIIKASQHGVRGGLLKHYIILSNALHLNGVCMTFLST